MAVALMIAAAFQRTASMGIESYSTSIYNELPDFYDTSHNGIMRHKEIKSLGQIFIDYDVYEDFGLTLLHKHFDLDTNEMIVETIYDNVSISSPIPIPVSNSTADEDMFGHRYAFINHNWVPVEFSVYSEGNPNIMQRHDKLAESDTFLLELGAKLTQMNLKDVFGVGIQTRDHFGSCSEGTVETEIGSRALMVTSQNNMNPEFGKFDGLNSCGFEAPAFWAFTKDEDGVVLDIADINDVVIVSMADAVRDAD
eukprot:CAMPEP_0201583704 /NCGR_PEP_ID=MMETSP0190_2-20130828/101422_1 /ASSEMBLY_ACC=CAM_ASM_000263 /TAXON_ID=37353 /ORGANISM="Rosalina sp." /LENGTH=252 /DNA_ID=CAMNT_0048026097 /DNA_START=8 /DNA_END=767 /DNA_ORIENTATION=+